MLSSEHDFIFKILLIGNSSVGKSSLLLRFADGTYSDSFLPTIGVDFKIRSIQASGSSVKLQMWDTAGQEKFKTITSNYYRGAHGIIMVFDLTNRTSFDDLQNWLMDAQKYGRPGASKILIGNKSDLISERQVTRQEATAFAHALGLTYLETSAKSNINVQEVFLELAETMKKNYVLLPRPKTVRKEGLVKEVTFQKKKTCC